MLYRLLTACFLPAHVKIDALVQKLAALREKHGNCDVFASLGGRSTEFLVAEAAYVERDSEEHRPSAAQASWLPSRAVLRLQHI